MVVVVVNATGKRCCRPHSSLPPPNHLNPPFGGWDCRSGFENFRWLQGVQRDLKTLFKDLGFLVQEMCFFVGCGCLGFRALEFEDQTPRVRLQGRVPIGSLVVPF